VNNAVVLQQSRRRGLDWEIRDKPNGAAVENARKFSAVDVERHRWRHVKGDGKGVPCFFFGIDGSRGCVCERTKEMSRRGRHSGSRLSQIPKEERENKWRGGDTETRGRGFFPPSRSLWGGAGRDDPRFLGLYFSLVIRYSVFGTYTVLYTTHIVSLYLYPISTFSFI